MTDQTPETSPDSTAERPPRLYVAAAFSLSMLDRADQELRCVRRVPRAPRPITASDAQSLCDSAEFRSREIVSCIGHADAAAVLSDLLERDLPAQRISVRLGAHDWLLVGQVVTADGEPYRLPAGCTVLPTDATIEWWVV